VKRLPRTATLLHRHRLEGIGTNGFGRRWKRFGLLLLSLGIAQLVPELVPHCWRRSWKGDGAGEARTLNVALSASKSVPSSSGWKSYNMLKVRLISAGVLPLSSCAMAWQVRSTSGLI
jgi:hypothetical protein